MDTKALRQKILDLAIHGKLVPQDPNDESASVLLERIKAEKERLIKEGKIKKSKKSAKTSDTPHYENVPFEVPEGWVWCRLEDIVCELKYGTSEKSSSVGKIAVLRMGNITNVGTIDYSNLVYSSNDEDIEQYSLKKDDLLFNRTNSSEWVGKTAIYKREQPAIYAGYLIRVRPLLISADYLNTVMNSGYYRDWCYVVKTDAVNQSNINAQKLSQLMIPIPPLEEQGRIVTEMTKWISLIDIVRNCNDGLQTIIKQTKSKILDLAIQGKLVPQDPNDEPAIELLKRINPDFTPCDIGHYEQLPQGWTTIKVGDVANYINGRAFKPEEWEQEGLPIIRIQNLNDKNASYNRTTETFESKFLIHSGDLLFAWAASLGTYIWNGNDAWLNQHIFKVEPYLFIEKQYLYYVFEAMTTEFYTQSHGSSMVHITKKQFEDIELFLPPLEEQKRIIQAIELITIKLDLIMEGL
mgnify:CR=1 FL=1|jgi:type I restriction enzyme S subunit